MQSEIKYFAQITGSHRTGGLSLIKKLGNPSWPNVKSALRRSMATVTLSVVKPSILKQVGVVIDVDHADKERGW